MSSSYAVLIGVEAADDLAPCPFAADEVRALVGHIETVDIAKARQTVLVGPAATRSAAESRLRRLGQSLVSADTVWFVFAGPAFAEDGRGFLACADTLADDRAATALAVADVFRLLSATGATVRFLLDAPGLDEDELADLFPASGPQVALTASEADQPSHAAAGRRLWLQMVGDALAGQAPDALVGDQLTAGSLRDWTRKELPRAVRKVISSPRKQTPQLFGPEDAVLTTLPATANRPEKRLDLKQLRRIVFRGETRDKVKALSGFQKNFKVPEAATPSAQKWTYRMAADDLRAEVEETYNALREHLGFKRKDLESTVGSDGFGFIRTPSFDFSVSVSLDPDDPSSVVWRREVSQVTDPDVLRADGFRRVFGGNLDTLQFDFEKPIDVEDLVDRIEDDPPVGVKVRVASDASACDVTVQGFAGRIHVERACLRVEGRPGLSPDSLVEQFFAFQSRFGGKKGLPALGA
ncbi:MAG TPA: hypothetical protein VKD90_22310 [Gemmataceae bacterium]|nr:hypothetical protein [Gemmataceae bacterium]